MGSQGSGRARGEDLPDDPKVLHERVRRLLQELEEQKRCNEKLRDSLAKLQRCTFGSKSDRVPQDQLIFPFADRVDPRKPGAAPVPRAKACGKREKRRREYRLIPKDPPRIVHRHGLPPGESFCDDGAPLEEIGGQDSRGPDRAAPLPRPPATRRV